MEPRHYLTHNASRVNCTRARKLVAPDYLSGACECKVNCSAVKRLEQAFSPVRMFPGSPSELLLLDNTWEMIIACFSENMWRILRPTKRCNEQQYEHDHRPIHRADKDPSNRKIMASKISPCSTSELTQWETKISAAARSSRTFSLSYEADRDSSQPAASFTPIIRR